jgi:hypothetical protein
MDRQGSHLGFLGMSVSDGRGRAFSFGVVADANFW